MKFGACLPNYGKDASREAIVRVAKLAEEVGYDSVWSTDHVLVPKAYTSPYGNIYDVLATLAYVAAVTERVKLGTSVIILPMRNPMVVAKQVASIDNLSNGRMILGIGPGWLEQEFTTLSVKFRGRGKWLDEAIELMRAIWSYEHPKFKGKYHKIEDAVSGPLPVQRKGPPTWIGGNSEYAQRRAAKLGDAWHPVGQPPEKLVEGMKKIRAITSRKVMLAPRVPVDLRKEASVRQVAPGGGEWYCIAGSIRTATKALDELVAAGAEYVVCTYGDRDFAEIIEDVKLFAKEIIPSFT